MAKCTVRKRHAIIVTSCPTSSAGYQLSCAPIVRVSFGFSNDLPHLKCYFLQEQLLTLLSFSLNRVWLATLVLECILVSTITQVQTS